MAPKDKVVKIVEFQMSAKDFNKIATKLQNSLSQIPVAISKLQSQMNASFNSLADTLGKNFADRLTKSIGKNLTGITTKNTAGMFSQSIVNKLRAEMIRGGMAPSSINEKAILKEIGARSNYGPAARLKKAEQYLQNKREERLYQKAMKSDLSILGNALKPLDNSKELQRLQKQFDSIQFRTRKFAFKNLGVKYSKEELDTLLGLPTNADLKTRISVYQKELNRLKEEVIFKETKKKLPIPRLPQIMGGAKITGAYAMSPVNYSLMDLIGPQLKANQLGIRMSARQQRDNLLKTQQEVMLDQINRFAGVIKPDLPFGAIPFDPKKSPFASASFRPFGDKEDFMAKMEIKDRAIQKTAEEYVKKLSTGIESASKKVNPLSKMWEQFMKFDPFSVYPEFLQKKIQNVKYDYEQAKGQPSQARNPRGGFINLSTLMQGARAGTLGILGAGGYAIGAARNIKSVDFGTPNFQGPGKELLQQWKESISGISEGLSDIGGGLIGSVTSAFETLWDVIKTGMGLLVSIGGLIGGAAYQMKQWGSDILVTTERFRGYNIAMLGTLKTQSTVDEVMKTSMKIAENLPIGYEQVFQGTKAMTLISPLKQMFKDTQNLESNMKDVWDIVIALSQIEPEWGIQGALYSLRETLSGDFMSIKRRYEIPVDIMMTVDGKPLSEVKKDPVKLLGGLSMNLRDLVPASTLEMTSKQFGPVMQKIQGFFDLLKTKIGESGFYDIFVGDMQKIQSDFAGFMNSFDSTVFAQRMSNAFSSAWEAFKSGIDGSIKYINRAFGTDIRLDTSSISNTIASLTEKIVKVFQYVDGIVNSKTIQDFIFGTISSIRSQLDYIVSVLSSVIPPILDGIFSVIETISDTFKTIRDYTKGWISDTTLVKTLIFGWLFGFQNVFSIISGIVKLTLNLIPNFNTISWIVGNLYSTFQLIMKGNELFITGTYKLLSNATSIGGAFSSIATAIQGAILTGLTSAGSILLSMLTTVGGMYGMFIMLPNAIYAMMKTFEIFPNTAFGRFVDWMKDTTKIGTPSATYQFEKAGSEYSSLIEAGKQSTSSKALTDYLKERNMELPSTIEGFVGSMQRNKNFNQAVSTAITNISAGRDLTGKNPIHYGQKDFAERLKSIIDTYSETDLNKTYKAMEKQLDEIAKSSEESVKIFGESFSENLKYIFSPNFAPHKALLSSIEEFGLKLMGKVKDSIVKPGSSEIDISSYNLPTQNNPEISFLRYSESNLSRMSNVMRELNDVFGTALKITSGSELLNRHGEFKHSKTSLHTPGLAFDVENLPKNILEDRVTYQQLNQIAQRNELPRIRLPYALSKNEKIKSHIDALTKEISDFRIDFEPYTKEQTETATHFELPGFSQGRRSKFWNGPDFGAIKAEVESKVQENPIFTKESIENYLEESLHKINNDVDTVLKETKIQVSKYGNLITLKDQSQEFWSKFIDVNTKIGQAYYEQQLMEIESQREVIRGTARKLLRTEAMGNLAKQLPVGSQDLAIPYIKTAEESLNIIDSINKFTNLDKIFNSAFKGNSFVEQISGFFTISDETIEKKIKDTEKLRIANEALNKGNENALKNTQLRNREIFNASAKSMKEVYQSIGEFGINVIGGNLSVAFEEITQNAVNMANVLFPNVSASLANEMTNIRNIQNKESLSFFDAMSKNIENLKSNLSEYDIDFIKKSEIIDALQKIYNIAAKKSPFLAWQEDAKDLKKEISSADFRNAVAMNTIRAKLPFMNRAEKKDYYTAEYAGLEFGTRGPQDSLRLGMESATVEFKNWSEQFFDAGKTLVDGLASTFETGFFDFMTGKLGNLNDMFRSIGRGILNTIGQIVSKMAAITATKIILGMDINAGGGFGGMLLNTVLGGGLGSSSGGIGPNTPAVEETGFIGTILNAGLGYFGYSAAGASGGGAGGIASSAAGGVLGGIFGKGGSLSNAWKGLKKFALSPQTSWILPAAGAAMFLSQPGRLWGGTKSTKSLQQAEANYSDASQFVNDIIKRRLSDSEKYMYAGTYRGIADYALAGPTLRTWISGDGWFKGPKEKHGAVDYTEQDRTLKGYYKLLEMSAEEDYLQRKKLNELRKSNEYLALKEETSFRQEYLIELKNRFSYAVSSSDYKTQDELRDKIYETKTTIDDLVDQTTEAFKQMSLAMVELKKKMVSDIVNLYSMEYISSKGTYTYKEKPEDLLSGVTYYSNIRDMLLNKNTGSGYLQDINIIKKLKEYATGTKGEFSIENTGYIFEKLNDLAPYLSDYYKTMDVAGERVTVSRDVVDELGRFITIGPSHYEWFVDKSKLKEKLAGYEEALIAKITLENTIGENEYIKSNLFNRNNKYSDVYKGISSQMDIISALGESAKTDFVNGGAQALADANLKISNYYQTLADQLKSWVDAGYLSKTVEMMENLSETAFKDLEQQVMKKSFSQGIFGAMKSFETMKDFTDVFTAYTKAGGIGDIWNFTTNKDFMNMGGPGNKIITQYKDPFDAYFAFNEQLIQTRMANLDVSSQAYYDANMDLFNLMAERAEHLKAKSEDSMRKLEELLDNIDQTMKLRIAEEAKTSKGDVVFLDLRTYSDMASEISKAIKNNDPQAMDLVDRLRKKLAGQSV